MLVISDDTLMISGKAGRARLQVEEWACPADDSLGRSATGMSLPPVANCNRSSFLGHVSVQTTERYLGRTQRIAVAFNDRIGIEAAP